MEEEDYIQLQTLLAKLRVNCLKEIGNLDIDISWRERNYKLIRNIDNIRNQMPLIIGDSTINVLNNKEVQR